MKDLLTAVSKKSSIGRTLRNVIIALVIVYVMIMSALLPVSTLYFEARAKEIDFFVGIKMGDGEPIPIVDEEYTLDEEIKEKEPSYLRKAQPDKEVTRVVEDESARTLYSKEYIMSDGSRTIEQFSQPIHYIENDEYKEIDNTLIEKNVSGKTEIENKANSFKAKFSKSDKDESEVEIILNKYNFKWTLQMEKEKKVSKEKIEKEGKIGKVKYRELYQDIDVEYSVHNSKIKEDIILQKRQEKNVFYYEIKTKHLELILQEDGSIVCFDDKTKEVVLTIPRAFMIDSNNTISYDIVYELERKGNGKHILKVLPNEDWLQAEERAYPVTIDPQLTINNNAAGLYSLTDDYEYSSEFRAISNEQWSYIYFPIDSIPKNATVVFSSLSFDYIGVNYSGDMMHVYRAYSNWKDSGSTSNLRAAAFGMGDSSNNEMGALLLTILLMYPMASAPFETTFDGLMDVDITNIVRAWQQNVYENHGLVLYTGLGSTEENGTSTIIFAREGVADTSLVVTINYRTNVGIENYWSYENINVGRAGSGYINQFNNQLTFVHNTVTLGGELPITLSHIYNDTWIESNYDINGLYSNMNVGTGWKLNYQQAILPISVFEPSNTDERYKFAYIDADGTPHKFWQANESSPIIDEDGLGYTLTIDATSIDSYYTLIDANKGKLKFYNTGRLYRVEDANGNYNEVVYDESFRIVEIVDRIGRKIKLEYLTNNYLIKVHYDLESIVVDGEEEVYNKVIQLEYVGATIYKFLYNDGKKSFYAYENGRTGKMTEIYNFDGYSIQFGFNSRTISGDAVAVRSITERIVTIPATGPFEATVDEVATRKIGELQFFVGKTEIVSQKSQSTFVEYATENEEEYYGGNLITTIIFDLEGRAVNSYAIVNKEVVSNVYFYDGMRSPSLEVVEDQEGINEIIPSEEEDVSNTISDENTNKLTKFSSFSAETKNYLLNSSFEKEFTYWATSTSNDELASGFRCDVSKSIYGNSSLQMIIPQVVEQTLKVTQEVTLGAGTYTLSGYISVGDNLHVFDNTAYGAFLEVYYDATTLTTEKITSNLSNVNDGFRLVSVTFTLETETLVQISNVVKNCEVFAWFDGLQLIEGEVPSYLSYNLLQNGGFDETYTGINSWEVETLGGIGSIDVVEETVNSNVEIINYGKVLRISNTNFGGYQSLYQDVYLDTSVSQNYVLSGWAKASQVNDRNNYALFGIAVIDPNNEVCCYGAFDKNILNWYQIAAPFSATVSGTYRVHVLFSACIGVAYFDNICLTTSDTSSYRYNEYGILESCTGTDGKTTTVNVQNGGTLITRTITMGEQSIDVEETLRDTNYNVSYVRNAITGAENSFTYDEYGNMTENIIKNYTTSTGLQIVNSTSYGDISDTFVQKITDINSRGFRTISTYDTMLGLLQGYLHQTGERKGYTYDTTTDLVKEIRVYKGSANTDYIKYTYDENYRISRVEYKNVYYRYEYNDWGQVIRVYYYEKNVNNSSRNPQLIQNSYNAKDGSINYSKNIQTGYKENYYYDEYGRATKISANVSSNSIKWYYNGVGQVVKMTDHYGNWLYDYDKLGRLIRASLRSSSAEVSRQVEEYRYDDYNRISSKAIYLKERDEENHLSAQNVLSERADLSPYVNNGLITSLSDVSDVGVRYFYDTNGYLIRENNLWLNTSTHSGGETVIYNRDDNGNLISKNYYPYSENAVSNLIKTVYTPYTCETNTYTYQNNDYTSTIKKIGFGDGFTQNYGYDELQRVNSKDIIDSDGTTIVNEDFTYVAGRTDKENSTTTLVSTKTVNGITFAMSYDYLGRITQIQDSRYTNPLKYYYDYYGSLYRENNPYSNQTILYQTSGAELISGVIYYPYTTSSTLGTAIEEKVFSRGGLEVTGDTANGLTITYNQNTWLPSVYHGVTLTWQYGQLQKYGTTIYRYDSISGRRLGKNVNGVGYSYYYNNEGRLYRQKSSVADIWFNYDNAGAIEGIKYNGTNYFYLTNPLGDVIGIIDSSGNVVVTYSYDAWGNILSTSGTLATSLGVDNPIRYRGYYYDEESGFYCLGSRYYDPYYGSFISKDSVESGDLWGYCDNDPVNNVDPTGYWLDTALDVVSLVWSVYDLVKDPTWENGAYAALDVACLALPFVSGAGTLKIVSKADDLVDATRAVGKLDDMVDAGRGIGQIDEFAEGAKWADEAIDIYRQGDNFSDARRIANSTQVGSYDILFQSNIHYIGKGSQKRAFVSASTKANKFNDTIVSIKWKPAASDAQAFIDEANRMAFYAKSWTAKISDVNNLYNRIWSPGKKLLGK